MVIIDPWASKEGLRFFLLKLKEDQELDALIKNYVREILGHKIVMSPSKGRYGEKGKDIVAIENESKGGYCSYIVKRGTLQKNLYGQFGVLKQMRDAMLIDLEIQRYKSKPRTAVIVHNGEEGTRAAIDVFENEKTRIERELERELLLRPIERWDIEEITNRLHPHGQYFKDSEEHRLHLEMLYSFQEISIDLHERIETISTIPEKKGEELSTVLMDHIGKIRSIMKNYSLVKMVKGEGKN
jgi:hypothetical protein